MRIFKIAILALVIQSASFAQEKLVYETESLYHHIIVSETPTVRILRFHAGPASEALDLDFAQSSILLADPYTLLMNYTRYTMCATSLLDSPKHALFIGLGAGTLPKYFAKAFPDCKVDVAELDEGVVKVARQYFFFPDLPNLKVTVLDGRLFVKGAAEKYDLVVLDAYRDEMIPFHLMTREFLEMVKGILSENGMLISNIAIRNDMQLYPWMLRTYQSVFPTVLEADVSGTINHVLICKATQEKVSMEDFENRAHAFQERLKSNIDFAALASVFTEASQKKPSTRVLTDDYAPVNLMRIRKADEKDWKY